MVRTIAVIARRRRRFVLRARAAARATRVRDGFVFAIGVTVALVPEALLPTVTLSLAWGAEQMAKRQRARPRARGRRDAGLDDVHLHRQDRHADPQPDGRRRGVDAGGHGVDRRRGLRTHGAGGAVRPRGTGHARAPRRSPPPGARRVMPSTTDGRVEGPRRPDGGGDRRVRPPAGRRHRCRSGRRIAVDARFPFDPRRRRMSLVDRRRGDRQGRARRRAAALRRRPATAGAVAARR